MFRFPADSVWLALAHIYVGLIGIDMDVSVTGCLFLCVSLWWIGDLSRVQPAFPQTLAGEAHSQQSCLVN